MTAAGRISVAVGAVATWGGAALAETSNEGRSYSETVACGGIQAGLHVNLPDLDGPLLSVAGTGIPLEAGPNYAGPVCVDWRGVPHVGFTEYMGNAYEIYRLVDPKTLTFIEITYREAEKLGWWD